MTTGFVAACVGLAFAGRFIGASAMFAAACEAILEWRFDLRTWSKGLVEHSLPDMPDSVVQSWLLIAVACIAGASIVGTVRHWRAATWPRRLQYLGYAAIAGMAAMEFIGRDDLAQIYYGRAGPLLVFVWWMVGFGAMTGLAGIWEASHIRQAE